MVVFFTIYNAQSQRKRKVFSCINQRPWKNEKKNVKLVFLRDGIWYVVCTSICAGHVAQYWYGSCLLGNGKDWRITWMCKKFNENWFVEFSESIEWLNNLIIMTIVHQWLQKLQINPQNNSQENPQKNLQNSQTLQLREKFHQRKSSRKTFFLPSTYISIRD